MTIELLCGTALGIWIAIVLYTWHRNHTDRKAWKRPVARDMRQTVTISDPLLQEADLVWSFETKAERQAFTLGVEAGRDSTITAMKLRKRVPPTYDLDLIDAGASTSDALRPHR